MTAVDIVKPSTSTLLYPLDSDPKIQDPGVPIRNTFAEECFHLMSWVYDDRGNQNRLLRLAERGVKTWGPERVYVGEDVDLQRISPGAELFNGRITGAHTFIGTGAQIGISGIAWRS